MTTVAAGGKILASHMNEALSGITPVITTTTATVGTVGAGFTVNDVRAVTLAGGKAVWLELYLSLTSAIAAATGVGGSTGNIADTTCFTLAVAFRPTHPVEIAFDNGTVGGLGVINTDGTVVLRETTSGLAAGTAVASASNIRISGEYAIG